MTNQKIFERLRVPKIHYDWSTPTQSIHPGAIHIIGFEFDGTACFRKGTAAGPNAIREICYGIEGYSPYLDKDCEEVAEFFDLGNLPVGASDDQHQNWLDATNYFFEMTHDLELKKTNTKFLMLGGEHSVPYAPIKKYLEAYEDLVLIHLDAHADLRDGYEGYHYSHASIMRRCLDHFGPHHELIQYGIRSGTKEEFIWMRENKTIATSLDEFIERVSSLSSTRPIYLTLDLDYFDPCYLPGTGTPEAGGETFHSFIKLLKILMNKNLVGADVNELSPLIDSTGNSTVFACKVVREIILTLSK